MSKRLDILGARIFGASVCHARKYLQPFRKCPNIWTKCPILAIMHKRKPHIIRTKACICAFCYFINFLHTFLDIFRIAGERILSDFRADNPQKIFGILDNLIAFTCIIIKTVIMQDDSQSFGNSIRYLVYVH